ncbi:evasin P1243-like [Haemaphysalis longicornis]
MAKVFLLGFFGLFFLYVSANLNSTTTTEDALISSSTNETSYEDYEPFTCPFYQAGKSKNGSDVAFGCHDWCNRTLPDGMPCVNVTVAAAEKWNSSLTVSCGVGHCRNGTCVADFKTSQCWKGIYLVL